MTINVERDFELVTLEIAGRLDTTTAPNLEAVINTLSEETKELVFDMLELEYISPEGISVLCDAHEKMNANHGIMRIERANETVCKAFEMRGIFLGIE